MALRDPQAVVQEQNEQLYPTGNDSPAYECDGVTQVGTFHVG